MRVALELLEGHKHPDVELFCATDRGESHSSPPLTPFVAATATVIETKTMQQQNHHSFSKITVPPKSLAVAVQRSQVLQIVFSFRPGVPLRQIIADKKKTMELDIFKGVDLTRLIGILQHKGFIERIREYSVYVLEEDDGSSESVHSIDSIDGLLCKSNITDKEYINLCSSMILK